MTQDTLIQHIDQQREAVRAYVPGVVTRLLMTYFVPLILAVAAAAAASIILPNVLPASTVSIVSFGVALLCLVFGWRLLENRTKATSLFVLFTRISRARRDLEAALTQSTPEAKLTQQQQAFDAAVQSFMDAVHEQNVQPAQP